MTLKYISEDKQLKRHRVKELESGKAIPGSDIDMATEVTNFQKVIGNRDAQQNNHHLQVEYYR